MTDPDQIKISPLPPDPNETHATRLKRLQMRSMRRGIKEMDLILSAFCAANLDGMGAAELDVYDALLHENDQDLYTWVTGTAAPPDRFAALIARISSTLQPD